MNVGNATIHVGEILNGIVKCHICLKGLYTKNAQNVLLLKEILFEKITRFSFA